MSERRGTSKWVRSWTAALLATGLAASSAFALEAGDIAPSFRAPRLSNQVESPPPIAATNRNETWPAWSPDGRHLYFSAAPPMAKSKFRQVRYDLVRVAYDIDQDKWGEPEILVDATQSGMSACQPKISPDSKSVLFTMCQYGNFPIYQDASDLYLLDIATRNYQRLDIKSTRAHSWHCWSTSGRWIVFSSKRL